MLNLHMLLMMKEAERIILSSKKFLRLNQISLAVDYFLQTDTAQTRLTHSIEVANTVEIMNLKIQKETGINIDQYGVGRIVGLLHDIGHTGFGHLGEKICKQLSNEYSKGAFQFEGNANNYITIKKNKLLSGVTDDLVKNYILASLAKHPEELYEEQQDLLPIIQKNIKKDEMFLKQQGIKNPNLVKTLQCQVMDIADENCYIISDIVDGLNILSKKEMKEILKKELDKKTSEFLIKNLFLGKNEFRNAMQKIFISFVENFTLDSFGNIVFKDKEIEELRIRLAMINRKYILGSDKIISKRNENTIIIETVFKYYFKSNGENFPSRFYKNQYDLANTDLDKLKIVRNMCGSFTDKGIKKEYKQIKGL